VGQKEVSGVALVVAQEVPTSSVMAVPHGPGGVRTARQRMRADLRACGAGETTVEDAVLVLSELLSNAYRHARPLGSGGSVRAAWRCEPAGDLTISVTDGGGPTRPRAGTPSVTARGGRGLAIITTLARDWGVAEERAEEPGRAVTVWAVLTPADEDDDADAAVFAGLDLADLDETA
jgi:anti-sigma regulatory factor (Ser/Thr protein kinase)